MGRHKTIPDEFRAEFDALKNAIHRCHNPQHQSYYNYGARGIEVQDALRTKDGWKLLIQAIGPRPSSAHSLDRINNDGHYTIGVEGDPTQPCNLKWSNRKEQQSNRRKNRTKCEDFGWGVGPLANRTGMGSGAVSPYLVHEGRKQTLAEWADELGIKRPTVRQRLRRGLTVEEALNPSTSRKGERQNAKYALLISQTIH